jgi:type IV pilus assembly protein PilB
MTEVYNAQALYSMLKELAVLPIAQLDAVYEQSKVEQIPLDRLLVEKDLLSDENVGKAVADLLSFPFISLSTVSIPDSATFIVPELYARNHHVIVFADEAEKIKIAMTNPHDELVVEHLKKKTGKNIETYYTTEREIEHALRIYKKNFQEQIDVLLHSGPDADISDKIAEIPIAEVVNMLIDYAYSSGASDIHIEPEKDIAMVRFRIDGIMHNIVRIKPEIEKQMVFRIKVLSKLRTDDHFSAQDGKLQISLETELLDIRVSIVPLAHGEKCVMRLLSSRFRQFGLRDLGMTQQDLTKVTEGFQRPHGMILSTGPTGSGKSTTMYSIVKLLNKPEKNIATIEDPIEYDIAGINQIQVNTATNLTFADGLRSILRQDPDIIYVGEIRDNETADIAINAALTGHLVLSTLHTNDAPTALPRLIDMEIEPFLIASTVNVIIAQRLVRKICVRCKVSFVQKTSELTEFFSEDIIKKHFDSKEEATLYKGKGCNVCHQSGYAGRIGVFEVLSITDTLRELITKKASSEEISKQAREEGMTSMLEDGIDKVLQGVTTIEEVLRTTRE